MDLEILMLKKQYRLKNKKAIDATYNNHQVVSNSDLILYVGKKKTFEDLETKFAFVVSKKYHKRAVKRNRIRRLMRESVRLIIKNNELEEYKKFLSFIFMPKIETLGKNFIEIDKSVKELLTKAISKYIC